MAFLQCACSVNVVRSCGRVCGPAATRAVGPHAVIRHVAARQWRLLGHSSQLPDIAHRYRPPELVGSTVAGILQLLNMRIDADLPIRRNVGSFAGGAVNTLTVFAASFFVRLTSHEHIS